MAPNVRHILDPRKLKKQSSKKTNTESDAPP